MIILLNGPSSAGKSSIAKELKEVIERSAIIALDDYLSMSADEPIWEDDVYNVMPQMCSDISNNLKKGCNLIIDHVITSERIYNAIVDSIETNRLFKVFVSCDISILRKREKDRGNRCIGSAEASLQYLYPKEGYELMVDSGVMSAKEIANEILSVCGRRRK